VTVAHQGASLFGVVLDESTFGKATADPRGFQRSWTALSAAKLKLSAYAIAALCINDR
jgi:hypothetical protein